MCTMARYRCSVCGEIYDEEDEGVRFEDLPDDWVCPLCHLFLRAESMFPRT